MAQEETKDEIEIIHSRLKSLIAMGDLISSLSDTPLRDETLAYIGVLLIWISEDCLNRLREIQNEILSSGGNE